MTRLVWNDSGERIYETGVDHGVLYTTETSGVVWNGLTSVDENPSGGDPTPYYLDGIKYLNVSSPEEFSATIEAFTYPDEFYEFDGMSMDSPGLSLGQQPRKAFGLSYQTRIGNDLDGLDHGYKIHLVYNALASPTQRSNSTITDATDPISFSWAISTTPIIIAGRRPVSSIVIDSTKTSAWLMSTIEDIIYGKLEADPRLPSPAELMGMWQNFFTLEITDNGDGTFTATGDDSIFTFVDVDEFIINAPSADFIDTESYNISSF